MCVRLKLGFLIAHSDEAVLTGVPILCRYRTLVFVSIRSIAVLRVCKLVKLHMARLGVERTSADSSPGVDLLGGFHFIAQRLDCILTLLHVVNLSVSTIFT